MAAAEDLEFLLGKFDEMKGLSHILGVKEELQQVRRAVELARAAWATDYNKAPGRLGAINERADESLEKIWCWYERNRSTDTSSSLVIAYSELSDDILGVRRYLQEFRSSFESARDACTNELDNKHAEQFMAINRSVDESVEKISCWYEGRRSPSSSPITYSELAGHIFGVQQQLPQFRSVMESASTYLRENSRRELRASICIFDDLVEEMKKWDKKHRSNGTPSSQSSSLLSSSSSLAIRVAIRFFNKLFYLREPISELRKLKSEYKDMGLPEEPNREASQLMRTVIVGRDEDVKNIITRIFRPPQGVHDHKLRIIPIVGVPGIGKTTVAEMIYAQVERMFDLRIWVHVSPYFNHKTVLRRMANSLSEDEDSVYGTLKEKLQDKRYLLVLDDVWNEDHRKWDALRKQLLDISGARGTVIVTTSRHRVAETMMMKAANSDPPYELQGLSEADCLRLFQQLLQEQELPLPQGQDEELKVHKMILQEKVYGLPLEVLNLTKNFMVDQNNAQDSISRRIQECYNSVSSRYEHLPIHLRYCFRFCSLFPQDHNYDLDELGEIWLALRYANYPKSKDYHARLRTAFFLRDSADEATYKMHYSMKELCHPELTRYGELWKDCFFHNYDHSAGVVTYKMHYSMHQLAKHLSGGVSEMMTGRPVAPAAHRDKPQGPLHLSLLVDSETSAFPQVLTSLKHLKTLILLREPQMLLSNRRCKISKIPPGLFESLNYLCVLDLQYTMIKKLPRTVGNLLNLRYLNLSGTRIITVPRYISKLRSLMFLKLVNCKNLRRLNDAVARLENLQKLDISGCLLLVQVPKRIDNLKQLRCMNIEGCSSLTEMPYGLGKCTDLHTLPRYVVGDEEGCTIQELQNLSGLEGELSIENLQKVSVGDDNAATAQLWNKKMLRSLTLQWKWWKHEEEAKDTKAIENVLEELQPNKDLLKLEIISCMGVQFPKWISGMPPYLASLNEIKLFNLKSFGALPPLGVLPRLRVVEISGMDAITEVDHAFYGDHGTFPSLRRLTFSQMLNLERWLDAKRRRNTFPRLTNLTFINCPRMVALEMDLPSVTELTLWLNNEGLFNSQGGLKGLAGSLKKLSIVLCQQLCKSSRCEGLQELRALEEMEISGCQELTSLSMGIRRLNSLKSLKIMCCNKMTTDSPKWSNDELTSLISLSVNGLEVAARS